MENDGIKGKYIGYLMYPSRERWSKRSDRISHEEEFLISKEIYEASHVLNL